MNRQEWIAALAEIGASPSDSTIGNDSPLWMFRTRYSGESPLVVLLEAWSGEGFGDPIYSECDDQDCEERGHCECETVWLGDVFDIDDATRAEFPEFGNATFATFYRSEQGFCYASLLTIDPR